MKIYILVYKHTQRAYMLFSISY